MRTRSIIAVVVLAVCLASCSKSNTEASSNDEGPIKIGQVALISGPNGPLGQLTVAGMAIAVDEANADGGVCDRQIKVITKDAGTSPESSLAAYRALKSEGVAVLGLVQGFTAVNALLSDLQADKMLASPTSWGASILASENYMMLGTTYERQAIGAVDWLVEQGKLKSGDTIGVGYLEGTYGGAVLAGVEYAADQNGLKVVSSSVEPTQTDMSGLVSNFASENAAAIFMAGIPDQTSSAASVASARGLDIPVVFVTGGFTPGLLSTAAKGPLMSNGYLVGGWRSPDAVDNEAIAALPEKLAKVAPDATLDRNVVDGYGTGVALINIMKQVCESGEELTSANILDEVNKVTSLNTDGVFPPQDYSDRSKSPSDVVYIFRPDASVPGGLKQVSDEYVSPHQASYVDDLEPVS